MHQRALIPSPVNHSDDADRFFHRDIDALTLECAWAEATLLKVELATAIFSKRRPATLWVFRDGDTIDDLQWLRERLERLERHLGRRAA